TNIAAPTGAAIGSNGDESVRVRNGRAAWTAAPNPNFVNELRFGWATDRQADTFDQGTYNPAVGLISLTVAGQTGLGAGVSYLPRVEPNEQRFQFADNVSWTNGKHIVKLG